MFKWNYTPFVLTNPNLYNFIHLIYVLYFYFKLQVKGKVRKFGLRK